MIELISHGAVILYLPNKIVWLVLGIIATMAAGYLLGSINFGVITSKFLYSGDVRDHGSGNAGMTNMLRTYGRRAAAVTFAGDAFKTVLAVFVGKLLLGGAFTGFCGDYIAGIAAIIGHAYPLYYKFKGGKGVVCGAMLILCTEPLVFAILLAVFVMLVMYTKIMSLGSIVGMTAYPLVLYRTVGAGLHVLLALVAGGLVVFLHRSNIKRLLDGTESRISFKRKDKDKETKIESKE